MTRRILSIFFAFIVALSAFGADPMSTDYTYEQCQGSLIPYPVDVKVTACPDTLTPVFINHVGRHGARYPASEAHCRALRDALVKAKESGTITELGTRLMQITDEVIKVSSGRWGALDSLGMYEQRVIASNMYKAFRPVFDKGNVNAISSYSPRAMMSMYSFTHQLDRMNNNIEFVTSTGRNNSYLLRPFDTDKEFGKFMEGRVWADAYDPYFAENCPTAAIARVLGNDYPYTNSGQKLDLAITEYYVLAGLSAMSMDCDLSAFFTREEMNALWSCFNLRQYLQRTATTISTVPADIAAELLKDLLYTTQDYIDGRTKTNVFLRFGHAETLMPLLSLMHIQGCYYMTNYFDTVAKNWRDFEIVPMAANIQMILFKNNTNNKYYIRTDLNGKPIKLIPNDERLYIPWNDVKSYILKCIPLYAQ